MLSAKKAAESWKKIRSEIKCCSCDQAIDSDKQLNVLCLRKEADWSFPTWGNVVLRIFGFAQAVICDNCLEKKKKVKSAVEWDLNTGFLKYHPIEKLKDISEPIQEALDSLSQPREMVGG